MTLRHLLSHTAGFTHEAPVGSNYLIGRGGFEAHCQSISETWLRFPVGHHHEYSNLGIDLAGYILQRVAGVSFARHLDRVLFRPLGLSRSTFDPTQISADPNRAIGHSQAFRQAKRPLPVRIPMVAAGGLYASVQDALRYVQFHLRSGEGILDAVLLAEQYRIPFPAPGQSYGYGLGVYIDEWEPVVLVHHHGGAGFGFLSQACWIPELSVGAVVLTNSFDHTLQNEIAGHVVKHIASGGTPGLDSGGPRAGHRTGPEGLGDDDCQAHDVDSLAGEYIGRLGDTAELFAERGRLFMRGSEPREAKPAGPSTIVLEGAPDDRYRFLTDARGRVRYLQRLRDGHVRYKNDAAATPASTLDASREGAYAVRSSGVQLATYRIRQDGDSPVIELPADNDDTSATRLALRLTQLEPDFYLSSMSEVLDLRSETPTYANVRLKRIQR